jgi:hypothetical protein
MDYPRDIIAKKADDAIAAHGGPKTARVYFKFTCPQCGARCTFDEPNRLWEEGECHACGTKSPVTEAGFVLHVALLGFPP